MNFCRVPFFSCFWLRYCLCVYVLVMCFLMLLLSSQLGYLLFLFLFYVSSSLWCRFVIQSFNWSLFFFFLVCHCAPTGIRAQIQIDTWQIQTMEIPRYCDSDQIMEASSPRIAIGAHLQVLVTPPNLVASFFGKRVAILAHGVRNGDCHQVRDGAFLRRS